MRSRRRPKIQFQPPFLVGALGALTLSAGGCVELTRHGDGSGGSGGGAQDGGVTLEGCPTVTPEAGSACSAAQVGVICGTVTCTDYNVKCEADQIWHPNQWLSCNPPAVSDICPEVKPQPGESCAYFTPGLVCGVATCTEPGITCGPDGVWLLNYMFCNPPGVGYGGMGGDGGLGGIGGKR